MATEEVTAGEGAAAVLAVTGEVGAGKSSVSRLFEELGAERIDADSLVAELWRAPDVAEAASARWGREVRAPDGRLSHRVLAEKLFAGGEDYEWACSLLHPRVKQEMTRRVRSLPPGHWAVAEIPLLFEAGVPEWVTASVFVTAPRSLRLARCRERGWDEAELTRREKFFLPSRERMRRSDVVIENAGSLEDLRARVRQIWAEWVQKRRP